MDNGRLTAGDDLGQPVLDWLAANAAHGIFTTDTALQIRTWNQWLAAATGVTAREAVGLALFDLFPSLTGRGFQEFYLDALSGRVKILSHSLHRHVLPATRSGTTTEQMPQSGRIAPLYAGDRVVGTITIVEDVTERVMNERALRAQIARAEQSRETAEAASRVKDEFLATLSHEMRTPLNAVLGWTQILRARREVDVATVRRAIEVIDRNASAQLTLITDMLDIARIATGKIRLELQPVDVTTVVSSAIDGLRPAADAKGVRLIPQIETHAAMVTGDPDRLLQIVWNLVSNAVKFTDSGGAVTVAVQAESAASRIVVADTGVGIAPAFLPQVFDRFKQADPSASRRHGGLGLGLALVRELVELHGGTVSAQSAGLGQGTTVTVVLPARPAGLAPASMPVRAAASEHAGPLEGLHILVVDDDLDALEITARIVTDAGATVTTHTAAVDALAAVRLAVIPKPAAIIADIGMPGADGYAFMRELRKLPEEVGGRAPAVAVTAYVTPADRRKALEAGFSFHVAKPFAPGALIDLLVMTIDGPPKESDLS